MKNDYAKCPGGGQHAFFMGECWKCSMTKREHTAMKKLAMQAYGKAHPKPKKSHTTL